jgi:hypothetical protein
MSETEDEDRRMVLKIMRYRMPGGEPLVGSMATATAYRYLGSRWPYTGIDQAVAQADGLQLAATRKYLMSYEAEMSRNPSKVCPHCGSHVSAGVSCDA